MELISYAMDFASFFAQKTKNLGKIKSIILFGSTARGEAEKESDVDLFIDVLIDINKIDKEARKIKDEFFNSVKFKDYWKLLGIDNEINIITGKLNEWKLKDSMIGSSIVLYQKYSPILEKGENMVLLFWGNIKPNSKRVMLNKKIFGYNYYGKRYLGLVEKLNGRKIGANVILAKTEDISVFLETFRKFKAAVKIIRVFSYKE